MYREYDKVIIGNNILAVATAYYEGVPIIIQNKPFYMFHEGICGVNKKRLWERFVFLLSYCGLALFCTKVQTVNILSDTEIEVILDSGASHYIFAKKIQEFVNFQVETKFGKKNKVLDYFKGFYTEDHDHVGFSYNRNSVKEIIFHKNNQIAKSKKYKDIICVSHLYEGKEHDDDNSHVVYKYQIRKDLEEAGIKLRKPKPGTKSVYVWSLKHIKREIYPLYEDKDEELLEIIKKFHNRTLNSDLLKITKTLGFPYDTTNTSNIS